ncbi:MAG: ATP-binding cassette domain-containing protein [Streptococcus salivarius]
MKSVYKVVKKDILVYSILTILLSIAMVSEAYLMQLIIDSIKLGVGRYVVTSIFVVVFLLIQTLIYYFQQSLTAIISKKSAYAYRNVIFQGIETPLELPTGNKNDKLLASLTTQIDQIEFNYFYSIYWGGYLICQLIIAIIVSLYLNFISSFNSDFKLTKSFVAILFKVLLKKQEELIDTTNTSVSAIQDLIEGIPDWRIANKSFDINRVFDIQTLKLLKRQTNVERSQYVVVSLNQLFSNVLYFGSWIIGGLLIINSQLTLGSLIAFSQLLVSISYPIYASSDLLAKFISGKKTIETLSTEFQIIEENLNTLEHIEVISFDNFRFKNNSEAIPFNGKFYKHKKYLLKGKSGTGKTTLLKAILREYNDYTGTVKINGIDVKSIKESSIFDNVAYVPQHPHMFNAKLRDNLTLFSEDVSEEELFEALKFVELSKWANRESLELMLSNDTIKLSGGEAKRVALARALLMKTDILFLDEFSSGIDFETLSKIENRLLQTSKLIIYITHVDTDRIIQQFDEIIDLNEFVDL